MKYYLGIYGGGTSTVYAAMDENNKILEEKVSIGVAIDSLPLSQVEKILINTIEEFQYEFSACYASIGGVTDQNDADLVNKLLKKAKNLKKAKINSGNDIVAAFKAAIPGGNGIVLIASTGTACYGQNGKFKHRAGGYGYKEGDPGSGFWIGHKAINYLARVTDKRLPETQFSRSLRFSFGCYDWAELAKGISAASRRDITKLTVLVDAYWKCKEAKAILEEAAAELKLHIDAVYKECNFKGKAKLALVGALTSSQSYITDVLRKQLDSRKYEFVKVTTDPSIGAALLAKELK